MRSRFGSSATQAGSVLAAYARSRMRSAIRTPTRTVTRTKRLTQNSTETRGGSESSFYLTRPAKGIARSTGKNAKLIFVANGNSIINSGGGAQVATDLGIIGDFGHLLAIMNLTQNQEYLISTPVGYRTQRIMLTSCFAEYAYSNATNAVARGVLFDIVPRMDIYNSTTDPGLPVNAWGTGVADESALTATSGPLVVGMTPFASHRFNLFYKVVKVTNVILAPGQTHYHRVNYKMNVILDNTKVQQTNVVSLKNTSLHHMGVFYGQPVTDSGSGVTVEPVKILTIQRFQYQFTYAPSNATQLSYINTLSTIPSANLENMATGAASVFARVT